MYLVVIMAFALVLSDDLPPKQLCLFSQGTSDGVLGTLGFIVLQALIVAVMAILTRRAVFRRLTKPSRDAHDDAAETYSEGQRYCVIVIAVAIATLMIFFPWAPMLRELAIGQGHLRDIPLVADLLLLSPFVLDLVLMWGVLYAAELRIRRTLPPDDAGEDDETLSLPSTQAGATLARAKTGLPDIEGSIVTYLVDKFRHQVLIIAAPMTCIVFAKFFTDYARADLKEATGLPWISDSILGVLSVIILACAPVMLRYIWATEPLPAGPLRDRFEHICGRIGLKYREILLWHTHGMAINAAVMGFIAPLRYVLISDALLETMSDEEIEAVFGHEAGHVVHWHLQFFVLFALVSMYIAGGVLEALWMTRVLTDIAVLQLIALGVLLLCWLFGFGWVSRRFERQADLHGIRCITPDIKNCEPTCPVHGDRRGDGLCLTAARVFGKTLMRIGDLNGIPRDAPSWRHGTIDSRCHLIADLAGNPGKVARFDRSVFRVKLGLLVAGSIGTTVAAVMYYHDIKRALGL